MDRFFRLFCYTYEEDRRMPDIIDVLAHIARACGDLQLRFWRQDVQAVDKDEQLGAHFATSVDLRCQELGVKLLHHEFPHEIVVAEEQDNPAALPGDCTVFDPLDGTIAYYNGCEDFGTTLCTFRDGQPVAGVIYLPVRRELITAVRGKGCWSNGTSVRLFWRRPLDKTMIGFDVGPWRVPPVLNALSARFCVRSLMAAVADTRSLLHGEIGAYVNVNIAKVWDAAAAVLAVEEAGGVACAPDGSVLQWSMGMNWIMAVNREIADALLGVTKQFGPTYTLSRSGIRVQRVDT